MFDSMSTKSNNTAATFFAVLALSLGTSSVSVPLTDSEVCVCVFHDYTGSLVVCVSHIVLSSCGTLLVGVT